MGTQTQESEKREKRESSPDWLWSYNQLAVLIVCRLILRKQKGIHVPCKLYYLGLRGRLWSRGGAANCKTVDRQIYIITSSIKLRPERGGGGVLHQYPFGPLMLLTTAKRVLCACASSCACLSSIQVNLCLYVVVLNIYSEKKFDRFAFAASAPLVWFIFCRLSG